MSPRPFEPPLGALWDRLTGRAFKPGPVIVRDSEAAFGVDSETFTPEKYGEYIATSTGVYACANMRARALSRLPIQLWAEANGELTEVVKGPAYELFGHVNPFWTLRRLMWQTELTLCLWGDCYWAIERGPQGRGKPTEIWWVRPDRMRVMVDPAQYIVGYVLEHEGNKASYRPDEIVRINYPNPIDEFSGLSPIAAARLTIETSHGAILSNRKIFDNGMNVGGIVSPTDKAVKLTPAEVEEIEKRFEKRFRGVDKSHKWAFVPGGISFSQVGLAPKDAQFIELLSWTKRDIALVFGIDPMLIGEMERSPQANFEGAMKRFWSQTMVPEAEFIATEITQKLLPMFGNVHTMATFDTSGVSELQDDRAAVVEQIKTLSERGVPINRLLEQFLPELMPKTGNGYAWGDVWWAPSGVMPVSSAVLPKPDREADEPSDDEPPEDEARALLVSARKRWPELPAPVTKAPAFGSAEHELAWKRAIEPTVTHENRMKAAVTSLFERQREAVLQQLRRGNQLGAKPGAVKGVEDAGMDPFNRARWERRFYDEIHPLLVQALADAGTRLFTDVGGEGSFDDGTERAARWLEQRAQRFARQINETTWNQLQQSLTEGIRSGESVDDLAARVEEVMRGRIVSSAEVIARTETISASNQGSLEGAIQSGVVDRKVWIAALDERTRETHVAAHGQTVPLNGSFHVGLGEGPAPGQIGIAAEDIQCRCTLAYELTP